MRYINNEYSSSGVVGDIIASFSPNDSIQSTDEKTVYSYFIFTHENLA